MLTTLLILGVSAVLFVQGRIRSDIVALCSLLCLIVFGILSPEQALSGFSNSIVVMMVGLFVVGGAIFRTGLAKMLGGRIMKLAGKSELRLLVLTMLVTAGIGAFVSNTGTVALMLPILVSLAADGGIQTSRLLMPMAFASSMGGMLLMIAAMVFNWVPAVAAVLIAAVLMVLCGCLRNVEEAYRTINWESIVLIAAMLPMSVALEKTGTSEAISHGLVAGLGGFGPFALMAGVYFTASLLTMFISNTATAVLLAPIALQSAVSMGISPYPLLLAVSVGTSMCFASPFSTPPNALVMPAGKYTFMDYVKVGVPLQVIMGLVMVVVIPLFFPFVKA